MISIPLMLRLTLVASCVPFCMLGCGGSQQNRVPSKYAFQFDDGLKKTPKGKLALALGDQAQAIDILQSVATDDPSDGDAKELLGDAKDEVRFIAKRWLDVVDKRMAQHKPDQAVQLCHYLLTHLPLNKNLRKKTEAKLLEAKEAVARANKRLMTLRARINDLLIEGRNGDAATLLREAVGLAWHMDRDYAAQWEHLLATAEVRLHAEASLGAKRAGRRKKSLGAQAGQSAVNSDAEQQAAQIAVWLRDAKKEKRRDPFKAITLYQTIIAKVPGHVEATRSLAALATKRKALIDALLKKANHFFQRQDLNSAVPFYRKVLILQPDNKRALEGIRMHQNLERIRKQHDQ